MKNSIITQTLLAIIALNLSVLSVSSVTDSSSESHTKSIPSLPFDDEGNLKVSIESINTLECIDVNIDRINGTSFFRDEIEFKVNGEQLIIEVD